MRRTPNSRFVLVLRGDPFLLPRGRGEEALALRFVESLHISSSSSFTGFRRRGRQRSGGFKERRPAAFTLVELMVVIALIGILSAMIVPEMRGTYEEALLRSTSRQLANLCNLAYSRAVSLQLPHRIVLDPISGKFALEKRSGRLTGKNFVPAQDVSGSEGELDNRISLRFQLRTEDRPDNASAETVMPQASEVGDLSGRIVIGFYPDGTADPAQIQLRDRQGFGLLLRISPVTARVRVTELARE